MPGKRTATITLDGDEYKIHAFKVGELEQLTEIFNSEASGTSKSLMVLRLALLRAEPPVHDFDNMEPTLDEVSTASMAILELAGLKAAANPQPTAGTPAA
jgi:hypothetical protein